MYACTPQCFALNETTFFFPETDFFFGLEKRKTAGFCYSEFILKTVTKSRSYRHTYLSILLATGTNKFLSYQDFVVLRSLLC